MKRRMNTSENNGFHKRFFLLLVLMLACVLMSACYMEPDRVVGDDNVLPGGTGGQNFQAVITNTPNATPTPTPAPTATGSDWTNFQFGNDTATNPPGNVVPIVTPTFGLFTTSPSGGSSGNSSSSATTKPTATPTVSSGSSSGSSSTSSNVLKRGAQGSSVKNLQQRLKDLKYYTGSVDGSFGAGTESAVKNFQNKNGLKADGIAGSATLNKLYSNSAVINTSSAGSSGSSSSGSSGSSGTSSSYTNGKTDIYLRLGSSGAQVKILQNRLIVLGYMSGSADGDFAETTEAAVIAFQKRNSIYADGVAGPTTLTKLYSSSAKKADTVAANLGSLREGMNGGGVRALQRQLKTLGYYSGSIDGDYGVGTTAAVIAFQAANGLTQDGIAGKATLNAIYAATGGGSSGGGGGGGSSSGTSPTTYGITASSNGFTTISSTTKKTSDVVALQSALSSTGYYSGSLDGTYGNNTAEAVSAFQRARGLRVTGMAGPTTQRLLYGGITEGGSYSKLMLGSSGNAVSRLQYALYELKYYDGNITSKFDEVTESSVRVFQQLNNLVMDGIAGEQTQQRLFSSNALPCTI